jgi:hypothetical protein
MTRIEIIRGDDLVRKVWVFDPDIKHSGEFLLRLISYYEQQRQTKRHKFAGEKWDYLNERSYSSSLKRPTYIPPDVLSDAFQEMAARVAKATVYIGWLNEESIYKPEPEAVS